VAVLICRTVKRSLRQLAGPFVAVALLALVASDLWIEGARVWWDRHSLTTSVVSSLLVLAFTGLIVDEVIARRQRQERAASVAVQSLIVYGQTRRAHDALVRKGEPAMSSGTAADEVRTLASMLLTASPNLFDDPLARSLLEEVERLSASMIRLVPVARAAGLSGDDRQRLASEMSRLKELVDPLLARIPERDRGLLEGGSQA